MEQPIRVKILDQEYLIRSDEEEGLVQEIAEFVHDRLMEIKANTDKLSESKTAILAAFHIASDYFQILKSHDNLVRDIQNRARMLNSQIDSVLS